MLFIVCLDEVLLPTGAPIQERVRAGLRNAKSKGVWLGRPRVFVSESRIDALRASGASWRAIAKKLGVALGMLHTIAQARSQNTCGGWNGQRRKDPSQRAGQTPFLSSRKDDPQLQRLSGENSRIVSTALLSSGRALHQ